MAATPSPVPDLRKNWRRVSALLIVSTGFMAFLTSQRFIEVQQLAGDKRP
jgi:hypothetical protein